MKQEFCRDYKKAWQGVSDVFLHYIYYYHKFYPKVYVLSMSPPYCYHKMNMLHPYSW